MASWTALATVSAGLVAYAVTSDGYPVHNAELNDGGVWITNQSMGAVGRQNVPVAQIDGRVFAGDPFVEQPSLDVRQEGAAVLSVDRATGRLLPIDAATVEGLDERQVVPGGRSTLFGGGSVGALDPASGKLWVGTFDAESGQISVADLAHGAKPRATVGGGAAGVAGRDGTLYAASADARKLLTLRRSADAGGFDKPVTSALGAKLEGDLAAMTTAGDRPVLLDEVGIVATPDAVLANLGDKAVLQQAGPWAEEVLVATPGALVAVDLDGGKPRTVVAIENAGTAAAPVRMSNGCTFAAWASGEVGTLATECGDGEATTHEFPVPGDAELVFRTNRNQIVLNDEKSGMAWTVTTSKPEQISNWDAFRQETAQQDNQDAKVSDATLRQPPQANPDELGARTGRTTTLHVLDNDLIASDGVLSIVDVAATGRDDVTVRIAPDRQTLLATVAPGATGAVSFRYTIDDGTLNKTSRADGPVTLTLRDDGGSGTPVLREHADLHTYPVVAGGVLEFPVTADWRDRTYGDPVAVEKVEATGGVAVSTTSTGLVRVAPPVGSPDGPQTVSYTVSTGGAGASGTVTLDVVAAGTRTVSPQTGLDAAAGEVDTPIVVKPLANDTPGADGADVGARMVLAGPVAPTGGLTVDTDVESGRVTVRAPAPGTYFLDYQAGFGVAAPTPGRIRVDVTGATKDSDLPIATPDSANARGMSPIVVDVLANDFDPKGRLLVVQSAKPSLEQSQLEVAVVDGRWLRINATAPDISPASQSVAYTISNGVATAAGSVSVTQRPPLTGVANAPVTQSDLVTVRAGDTVRVPVLDNDATPSGDPVGLVLDETVDPRGELAVLPALGRAYVSGRQVRFVAPETVDGPVDVGVQYVAQNTGDPTAPTAVGTLRVHVTAPPSSTNPNRAPTPRALEGRAVQGDKVTIKLPAVGSDPDGDSVAVTGIETSPSLGHVISWGANSLTYQAFPGSTGTDEFRYTVADRYGATASASVRIGVVPPGEAQAPLALDDELTAAPGRTVDVDVIANDMHSPGARLEILPLEGAPAGTKVLDKGGPVSVVVPDDGQVARVVYTISNGLAESSAVLTLTGKDGFNNPPMVTDLYATPKPGADSVEVDVLGKVHDVDGPEGGLELESVTGGARITGGKVVVTIKDVAQVLAYRVLDDGGAAAAAAIYVPARHSGAPYLRPGAEITVDPGGSVTADLADLVIDPEGDPVRLTTEDTLDASPASLLSLKAVDETTLSVTAEHEVGPGVVSFEVVDRAELDAKDAQRAFISVPVRVGDPDPVITCPDTAIDLPRGGDERTIDIASICHVWTADGSDPGDLSYKGSWADGSEADMKGVEVRTAATGGLRLEATKGSRNGASGWLEIATKGHRATGRLAVRVVDLSAPTLTPIRLEAKQGEQVTVDVAQYVTSQLPAQRREIEILSVTPYAGASAKPTFKGSSLTFATNDEASGALRYRIEVSDAGGDAGRSAAVGDVVLVVAGVPSAPTNLRIGTEILANTVALTWTVPDNNGARVDQYEVVHDGGTFPCAGPPCRVTGLDNGRPYSFRVRAHNAVGWSDPSEPVSGAADAYTGPVLNLRVVLARDDALHLAWDAPSRCDCSAVEKYRISSPGIGNVLVDPASRSYVVRAANGANTTMTVTPLNAKGMADNAGPASSVAGVAAGAPPAPAAPTLVGSNEAGNSQKTVAVSWAPVAANGPGPVSYEVRRGGAVVCTWTTVTRCTDAGLPTDGTVHSYTVRARNAEATSQREAAAGGQALHVSPASAARTIEASAPPTAPTITSVTPTGDDGAATVKFDVGPSHGKTNTVTCMAGSRSCGSWTYPRTGAAGQSQLITGLPDGVSTQVVLTACNGGQANICEDSAGRNVTTYGPIGQPTMSLTHSGQYVTWNVSVDPNGRPVHLELLRIRSADCPSSSFQNAPAVLINENSGTTLFRRGRTDLMMWNACFSYKFSVTDSSRRSPAPVYGSEHTDATPVPAVRVEKTTRCASGACWNFRAIGDNFEAPSTCRIYRTSNGAQVGREWRQTRDWVTAPDPFPDNTGYGVRCDNGALSQESAF